MRGQQIAEAALSRLDGTVLRDDNRLRDLGVEIVQQRRQGVQPSPRRSDGDQLVDQDTFR
jgi:hypothetical protein